MIERLAYNPSFDRRDFLVVQGNNEAIKRQSQYTKRQIETHLGERFNVLLSTTNYELRDGKIFGENMDESFLDVIKRGVVTKREEAELTGFSKIQDFFANDARGGDMMVSISPPGGEYLHNFYDVFTLQESSGEKTIEARRYSSALTPSEYQEKIDPFKSHDEIPTDIDFLSNPIVVDRELFKNPDDVHKYLHKEHEYMGKEDFDSFLIAISPIITSLINSLANDPYNERDHSLHFNAIYNHMDDLSNSSKIYSGRVVPLGFLSKSDLKDYIYTRGVESVRQVMTACGASGGFSVAGAKEMMNSPFSVADKTLGKTTEKQTLCCTCPFCNRQVEAEIGGGRITCPNCNKSASWN